MEEEMAHRCTVSESQKSQKVSHEGNRDITFKRKINASSFLCCVVVNNGHL